VCLCRTPEKETAAPLWENNTHTKIKKVHSLTITSSVVDFLHLILTFKSSVAQSRRQCVVCCTPVVCVRRNNEHRAARRRRSSSGLFNKARSQTRLCSLAAKSLHICCLSDRGFEKILARVQTKTKQSHLFAQAHTIFSESEIESDCGRRLLWGHIPHELSIWRAAEINLILYTGSNRERIGFRLRCLCNWQSNQPGWTHSCGMHAKWFTLFVTQIVPIEQ